MKRNQLPFIPLLVFGLCVNLKAQPADLDKNFLHAKQLIEANCGDCIGGTREGLEEGIAELTANHWKIIDFCRQSATANGKAPTLRQVTVGTGVTTKDLFAWFPKGPAKKVAKISGLGKPEGCV